MHPLLQGKGWCGGLQGHVPGQTLTSREAQGQSAVGETTRGSGGPGGGGAGAVGSLAPSSVLTSRGSEGPVLGREEAQT